MSKCTGADIVNIALSLDMNTIRADKDISTNISLNEQGVDSLDKMNIFLAVEETYGLKIPDEDFDSLNTFDSISDYINQSITHS